MPVWHELTRELRESGELVVIGLIQEQHPKRCELYAQWQGLDWPILWDPFNLTGSKVVPNAIAIDEHGVVRQVGARSGNFMESFMEKDFPAPESSQPKAFEICAYGDQHGRDLGPLEQALRGQLDQAVQGFEAAVAAHPEDGASAFRAGVACRMRYDSAGRQPDDFQRAVDHWTQALFLDPNQYIWRRRIQQYGPRMDKPYPFYSWIAQAGRELRARQQVPVKLLVELTASEVAEPSRPEPSPNGPAAGDKRVAPKDPEGRITRDAKGLIQLESALAFDTSAKRDVGVLHLAFRPNPLHQAHWNHESGSALEVWLEAPTGWSLSQAYMASDPPFRGLPSSEVQHWSPEVRLPEGQSSGTLRGHALYYVCEGASGACLYLRQDFEVAVQRPQ